MIWLEITVNTVGTDQEEIAAALTAAGFSDLVLEDQREIENFLEQNRACWDYIDEELARKIQGLSRIRLYLESTDAVGLERLKALAGRLGLPISVKPLADADWQESWKENYPPVEVGKNLVVLPVWLADAYSGARIPVILNPGLTFGTGAHPSTQMVMEAMESAAFAGMHCLDLGSGSGILSITALRLGAARATGVDIDPKAEDAARENAACNGYGAPEFTALTGNVTGDRGLMTRLSGESYDMVLVNIVADVIIGLAPALPAFLGKESVLICSGILDCRLEAVIQALQSAGLCVIGVREKEEWRCIIAKRR